MLSFEQIPQPSSDKFRTANGWLVGGVLFDPAIADHEHGARVLAWLSTRKVCAVASSHSHRDHTNGVLALATRLGVPVTWAADLRESFHGWGVFRTPGHARDHVCFYLDGLLVAADMLGGEGWPVIMAEGADFAAYRDSARRLRALGARMALPGHGNPIEDVDRALAEAEMRGSS